jgi:membrane protease YdiL (CAAX protease family)
MNASSRSPIDRRVRQLGAVFFALIYPTILTWVYFRQLANASAGTQQTVFVAGKAIQFLFPAIWLLLIERGRIAWKGPTRAGIAWGVASGLLIGGAMLAFYFGWLRPSGALAGCAEKVRSKLFGIGLRGPAAIISMSVFYSLMHSLLEETYWRWFVYGRLRRITTPTVAVIVSSLGFMAHHVILLQAYLPLPWWPIAAAGVAVGGAFWCWRYARDGAVWGVWFSHMLVDAAIFAIGFQMAFQK